MWRLMMYQGRFRIQFVLLLAVTAIVWPVGPACVTASEPRSPWESWDTLRLNAKSVPLFSGNVQMQVSVEQGKTRFETQSTARFFGARIAQNTTLSIMDGKTGRPERYESVSKKRARRYVYSVEKLMPPEGPKKPVDEWEVRSRKEFAYPENDDGDTVEVYDYNGMFFHLRDMKLEKEGDEAVIHIATSSGPTAYRILVAEVRAGECKFTDPKEGAAKTLPVKEMRLRIIPVDPERAKEGFMKMEGETELWVEAVTKTPLQLSGKVPKVPGRVRLVLAEMG
jgi:hypothetical protein